MSTDNHGRTPLHAAAERGYEAFVRYLLDGREPGHLRDTLLEASDAKHYTALHYAVAGGFLQVVQALLGAHSDSACLANMQAKSDETGEVETALSLAVKGGFTLQLAQALLAAGAHPVGAGSTLHWACKYNHLELVDLLLQAQADPNVANCDNHVPLVYAVQGGHTAIIQRLLDGSADVNRDMDGNGTALHWACRSGNRQVAALLLRNQAACDVLDAHGNTPFMVCASQPRPPCPNDPHHSPSPYHLGYCAIAAGWSLRHYSGIAVHHRWLRGLATRTPLPSCSGQGATFATPRQRMAPSCTGLRAQGSRRPWSPSWSSQTLRRC